MDFIPSWTKGAGDQTNLYIGIQGEETMELCAYFKREEECSLPIDYRSYFMSFLKSAFQTEDSELCSTLYSKNKSKAFTFGVHLGGCKVEGDRIFFDTPLLFKFRSSDHRAVIALHNYLIKKPDLTLGEGITLSFEKSQFSPLREIKSGRVLFRSASPIFIRSLINRNFGVVSPCENFRGDEEFENAFIESLSGQAKELLGREIKKGEISFQPGKLKRRIIKHMKSKLGGQYMKLPCFTGSFTIGAPVDVLNIIHQTGLGGRRSQGFGMVEVVKELETGTERGQK